MGGFFLTNIGLTDFDCGNLVDGLLPERRRPGALHLVEQLRDDGVEPAATPNVVPRIAVHLRYAWMDGWLDGWMEGGRGKNERANMYKLVMGTI